MTRKRWSLFGACMFLAITLLPVAPSSAATPPAAPEGCARSSVWADHATVPGAYVSAGIVVAAPLDPSAEDCRPTMAPPELVLAPAPEVDPCTPDASRTRATVHAPVLALDAAVPVGTPCADPNLHVPGPLVVSVYWNGSGVDVEWVYQGSFDCVLLDSHYWSFRIECTPLDAVDFHCVNPGVAATYVGANYVRTGAHLECGDIAGECWTPWGGGACSTYLGGNQQALVVCSGLFDVIVGGDSGSSDSLTATCYSDPPELPRRESILPGDFPVVESFVRV